MENLKHKNITQEAMRTVATQLLNTHLKMAQWMTDTDISEAQNVEPDELYWLLNRQARYGVFGKLSEGDMLPDDFNMMEMFAALEALYSGFPFYAFDNEKPLIKTIQLAAKARHELVIASGISMKALYDLDDDFEPTSGEIELSELAALSDLSVQSIRNDISKNGASLTLMSRGGKQYVSIAEASEWLKSRNSFKPTMNLIELGEIEQRDNVLYVPIAKDGTHFCHKCRMTRGYQIGDKGDERYVESFYEALSELLMMPLAKWRRPNEKGNFGIVSAVEWKFVDRNLVLGN